MDHKKKCPVIYILIAIFLIVIYPNIVMADSVIIGDNGSGGGSGATNSGDWDPDCSGVRITIVDKATGKKIAGTSNLNVLNSTCSISRFLTQSQRSKIEYLTPSSSSQSVKTIQDSAMNGDISGNYNLKNKLEASNYKNLKKYITQAGLNCVSSNSCTKEAFVIVESMTSIGNYYATAYEFAKTNTFAYGSYRSAYLSLGNTIYSKSTYTFDNISFEKFNSNPCPTGKSNAEFNVCYNNELGATSAGMGIYKLSSIINLKGSLEVTKKSTTGEKIKGVTLILKKGSKKISQCTTNSDGKCSMNVDVGTYNLYEQKTPSGYQPQSGALKKNIKITSGTKKEITVTNAKKPDVTVTLKQLYNDTTSDFNGCATFTIQKQVSDTKWSNVIDFGLGKKCSISRNQRSIQSLETGKKYRVVMTGYKSISSNLEITSVVFYTKLKIDNVTPDSWSGGKRSSLTYTGKDLVSQSFVLRDNKYTDVDMTITIKLNKKTQDEPPETPETPINVELRGLKFAVPNDDNSENLYGFYSYEYTVDNPYRPNAHSSNSVYVNNIDEKVKEDCKNLDCYMLYKKFSKIAFQELKMELIKGLEYSEDTNDVVLSKINDNWSVRLHKKKGDKYTQVRCANLSLVDTEKATLNWNVSSSGYYYVAISHNNCSTKIDDETQKSDDKVFSKTSEFDSPSGLQTSDWLNGWKSRVFYVGNNDHHDIVYYVSSDDNCVDKLNRIKSDNYNNVFDMKNELLNLYSKYSTYSNLLNFTSADSIDDIKNKINSSAISCRAKLQQVVSEENCNSYKISSTNKVSFDEGDNSTVALADYANSVSKVNWSDQEHDDLYCYVQYQFDFSTLNIIKDNDVLYGRTFLWSSTPTNKVGTLNAKVHCEGRIVEESSGINAQKVREDIKNSVSVIKLQDNNGKQLQTISVSEPEDIEYESTKYDSINQDEEKEPENNDEYINEDDDNQETAENMKVDEEAVDSTFDGYKYYTFDNNLQFPLIYDNYYYASLFSGTVINDISKLDNIGNLMKLGWGVPIDQKASTGKVNLDYSFDEDSIMYNVLNLNETNRNTNMTATCSFKKRKSGYNIREIDIEYPFYGKNGKMRTTGKNWNSCYNAIFNKIGTISEYTYCDLFPNSCGSKDGQRYCMYGDANCNGTVDIMDSPFNPNFSYTGIQKKLFDVNGDGILNRSDETLFTIWYEYKQKTSNEALSYLNTQCTKYAKNYTQDPLINSKISNANNSDSNKTPMYSFTLSPTNLKAIRDYNKANSYSNELQCNKGQCISDFITDLVNNNHLTITSYSGTCLENKYQDNSIDEAGQVIEYKRKLCSNLDE